MVRLDTIEYQMLLKRMIPEKKHSHKNHQFMSKKYCKNNCY